MKSAFRKSFTRDLKKIKDPTILDRVREVIEQGRYSQGESSFTWEDTPTSLDYPP